MPGPKHFKPKPASPKPPKPDHKNRLAAELAVAGVGAGVFQVLKADQWAAYCLDVAAALTAVDQDTDDPAEPE